MKKWSKEQLKAQEQAVADYLEVLRQTAEEEGKEYAEPHVFRDTDVISLLEIILKPSGLLAMPDMTGMYHELQKLCADVEAPDAALVGPSGEVEGDCIRKLILPHIRKAARLQRVGGFFVTEWARAIQELESWYA